MKILKIFLLSFLFLLIPVFFLFGGYFQEEKITNVDYIKVQDEKMRSKTFYGIVKAQNNSNLSFQSEGKIIYMPYTKGDFVKKGDVIARLDGELYTLPAPVSAFLENGWTIVEDDSHQAVVAKGIGGVTLEKEGVLITTDVVNYTDSAVYIENCFVTTVYVDLEENENGDLTIPTGICVKMPVYDLEQILENIEYETSMDRKYTYYTIKHEGTDGNGFIIRVNKGTASVDSISCQNMPSNY